MKSKILFIIILVIFSSLYIFSQATKIRTVEGKVERVSDGDTFKLITDDGETLIIRLYGIDAPEIEHGENKPGQPYGEEAYKALSKKINNKQVKVDIIVIDRYKRSVGLVHLRKTNINLEMIKKGYAWAYEEYLDRPYATRFINAEKKAREKKLVLWQENNPTPPWEYRKKLKLEN